MISNGVRDKLNRFTSMVWHNGTQAVLRRHNPEGFEYIDLEGYLDSFQFIFGPAIVEKVLVRDEYRTALQVLQTAAYNRGAYVTGHPGIGNTNFLVYLLVELLGQHCKVAVHDNDGQVYALLADTAKFSPLTDRILLLGSRDRVWTLSHSNARVPSPPPRLYVHTHRTRMIQTTAPKKECWHEWSKQVHASCYVMDIWTEQEIANLAKLFGFDVQRMMGLRKKWGGVPRTLLEYVDMPDQEIETLYRQSATVTKCRTMSLSVMANVLSEDTMTQLYFCRPLNFTKPRINRKLSCAIVPTPTICHFLAEALQKLNNPTWLEFFDNLNFCNDTRGAAKYIYKSWLHCFLSAGKSIDCNWPHPQAKVTSLRGTATLVSARSDELKDVKKLPYYWVAPPKFPGIDGALIFQDAIFAFQVAIRMRISDKPPEEGLEKLRDGLPVNLKDLPWHLVFVGKTKWPIEAAASQWAGKMFLPTSKRCVTVGWSQVHPVEEGITHRTPCG